LEAEDQAQSEHMTQERGLAPERDLQIAFARHNFEDQQALIRAADAKAGAFITLLLFLAAIVIPLGNEAVRKLSWVWGHGDLSSGAYVGTCILFALAVVRSLALVIHVVRPRGVGVPGAVRQADPRFSEDYPKLPAADKLLFYKHILQHGDPHSYFSSVSNASPDLLLRNLTDQTFELARICDEKMSFLHAARMPLLVAVYSWALNIALAIWIAHWK
jgi:hypothetical protein